MLPIREITIQYQPHTHALSQGRSILSADDSYRVFDQVWDEDINYRESFYVLYLNTASEVIGVQLMSKGGISATMIDRRLVFATALKCLSTRIILAHNHPSGTLKPSRQDLITTRKLKDAGELLDIEVLDHLIMTPGGEFYSFADNGLL